MKRKLMDLIPMCLAAAFSIEMVSASAEEFETESENIVLFSLASVPTGFQATSMDITPFASPIISGTAFSITKTQCWIDITLNKSYSGTISAVIQKQSGSSWVNHTTMSSNESFIYKSRS